MTKAELLLAIESWTDDTEIFVLFQGYGSGHLKSVSRYFPPLAEQAAFAYLVALGAEKPADTPASEREPALDLATPKA